MSSVYVILLDRVMLMNFVEAMELLRALSGIYPKTALNCPRLVFFDAEKEGYMIYLNENSVEPDNLIQLEEIVETRHLSIRKNNRYLVIRS